MKLILATMAMMVSTTAYAQDDIVNIPTPNKDIWTVVPTQEGAAFYHRKSKAICDTKMRDLTLVGIKDYTPDGMNSSCQYEKKTDEGTSRLTMFIYTYPDISGPAEYKGAKQAILDNNKMAAVTITEDKAESRNCFNAVVPKVAEAMLKKNSENNADGGQDDAVQMGIVMFNMDVAANANQPASSYRTLLSLYQNDEWVIKIRVTVSAGETSSLDACRYAGLPSIALARQMD